VTSKGDAGKATEVNLGGLKVGRRATTGHRNVNGRDKVGGKGGVVSIPFRKTKKGETKKKPWNKD